MNSYQSKHLIDIQQLLNYCLGYIKLVNPSISRYKIFSPPLTKNILDPNFIYDTVSDPEILLNLETYYKWNPKDLPEEEKAAYNEQKIIAQKLEEIANKQKVNEYTKQINLNFGYFNIELPEDENVEDIEEQTKLFSLQTKKEQPLFAIPIEIHFIKNKYYISLIEDEVIPQLGFLQNILDEDSYSHISSFVNSLEINGQLRLPLKPTVINSIWEELKGRLKLSSIPFDENSFDSNKFIISLSSKSNYFLVQDLKKLVELNNDDILNTSLSSWVLDDDLNNTEQFDEKNGELFFPLEYNKYQLQVLSVLMNKAVIIEGPPGTGKSQTIANILCHLAATGKKVLFLSQKAQALKVVKDYLKQLEIDYLYGYIPNRYSQLYSSEEEEDGAAYTLSGIQQFINFNRYQQNSRKTKENLFQYRDLFDNSIGTQRTFYYLNNQLQKLEKYKLEVISPEKFIQNFNKESYYDVKSVENEIYELETICSKIINEYHSFEELETKYSGLNIEVSNYSVIFEKLVHKIQQHGYDRKGKVLRFISHTILKYRLKELTNNLPLEIYSTFEYVLEQELSRNQMAKELTKNRDYFIYQESIYKNLKLKKDLEVALLSLGIDLKTFKHIENLLSDSDFETTINSIKNRLEIEKQIKALKIANPNAINKTLGRIKTNNKKLIQDYIRNRIHQQIVANTQTATIKGIIARIARALNKSKKAYKTFDQLKNDSNNFKTIKELIPIWIMDLEDASRLIPLEKNLFDYIILDEASQCNIAYAIPAMYRSKHVLFFGDSEQMRDDSIKFKTNRSLIDLAEKYSIPDHLQVKSKSDAVKSVLDIGTLRGFKVAPLLYHYRSPKEVIGFSNENFYAPKRKKMEVINSNYLTYKNTNRIMINHILKPDKSIDISDKTNLSEAEYIADLVNKLKDDPKTKNKSIGVLTFFNEQANILRQLINDEDVKVSIIEGIQGDEKDIIIFSFVIADPSQKKRYIPLTSEKGEINKELNQGRVNVAFSRARLQVHCVTSLPINEWPEGIWIKRFLEYVEENGIVNFYDYQIKPFDSNFEKEFYYYLKNNLQKDLVIQNQIESCGYKIDFVISDLNTGKRLAIECDGPTHFIDENSDTYINSDIERQNILEAAGWEFYRVLYSEWIDKEFDRKGVLTDIFNYFGTEKGFLKDTNISNEDKKNFINSVEETQEDRNQELQNSNSSTFKEVVRVSIDQRKDLVGSLIENNNVLWINEYYKEGSYIGYSNKGIGLSSKEIDDFIYNSAKTIQTGVEHFNFWKGEGKSKILIRLIDNDSVDVRQFVESPTYTGFTKRGFRINKIRYVEFLQALSKVKINFNP